MVKATILIDNRPSVDNPCLQSEHGLCLLVETQRQSILCDTGATGAFADNARLLGIGLSSLDMAVISHGHNDHTGGVTRLLAECPDVPVYASRHIFGRFSSTRHGHQRDISAPDTLQADNAHRFNLVAASCWLSGDVALVECEITDCPMPLGNRYLLCDGIADPFNHEMSLAVVDDGALVIFSPCSHCGAINIIQSCRRFTGIDRVRAFVGGLHFVDGPDAANEADRFARDFSQLCPQASLFTGHCTCRAAREHLLSTLPRTGIFYTGHTFEV